MMHDEERRLNIAFLTSEDPEDRASWSGLTYHMAQAMQKYCGNVTYLGPIVTLEKRIAMTISRSTRYYFKRNIVHERLLLVARKHSKVATQRLAGRSFDVIFAPIGTAEIAFLETDIPIVLAEGSTFNSMHNYYPACSNMPNWSVREAHIIQDRAYKKAQAFIYPSEWAAHSAVRDCHVSEQKVYVVPHGANFENIPSKDVVLAKKKSDKCRLLFIGREWERKGGDIAFETLLRLEELGIQAELTVCGNTPPKTSTHERMKVIPFFLNKNDEKQLKELEKLYMRSDFLLVPTRQEIFGIVFCEASAFGLPSITTDTGGVSGAVQDGKNGFRLPYSSGGEEYAKLIADIYCDDQRYAELVRSTRETFDERLNWDAWGATVRKILLNVLDSGPRCGQNGV
jgi:glycosyltransferase involved in cell wall biosynthesis